MKAFHSRKLAIAGLCIAIGVVLPQVFHLLPQGGQLFLPMHFPILLCGLVCGWPWGLACGILTPLLSSLLTGSPNPAYLPAMVCELAAYGISTGLLARVLHTKWRLLDRYLQLIGAMLLGRLVYGAVNAFFFSAGHYTLSVFLSAAFITASPGILCQLILLPPVVLLLDKARLSPPDP